MSVRTSQRLVAISFIVGTSAMLILFARLTSLAELFSSAPVLIAIGGAGWIVMLSACVVVVGHPNPGVTFLGRFALMKEPLLRGDNVDRKRKILTISVVVLALAAVTISLLFLTDTVYALYEKYVFGG